ncbi:hypothetical protein [Pseudoxanthomonas mexicana]
MPLPDAWWPWLAVAGLGALHGLNPANGWLFAAARATQSGDARDVRRTLLPIALGHGLSVALVVVVVIQGIRLPQRHLLALAGSGLLAFAAWRLVTHPRAAARHSAPRSHAGLAAWSCLMGTAQGSGLMLLPALLPLCMTDGPARAISATGSLALMLAAVVLHLLAMLGTTQIVAKALCRATASRGSYALGPAWPWHSPSPAPCCGSCAEPITTQDSACSCQLVTLRAVRRHALARVDAIFASTAGHCMRGRRRSSGPPDPGEQPRRPHGYRCAKP